MSQLFIQDWAQSLNILQPINESWIQAISNYYGVTEPVNGSWEQAIALKLNATNTVNGTWLQKIANELGLLNPVNENWIQSIANYYGSTSYVRFLFDYKSSADAVVGDSSQLSDWNTAFNSNFTSLLDVTKTYILYGYFGTTIGFQQFMNINIYEVQDLNTISLVEDSAFADSALNLIHLTECISIGDEAFKNCPLDTIYLPKVDTFDKNCFLGINSRTITLTIKNGMENNAEISQLIIDNIVTLILV
jgi:hypothetical protein